MYIYIFICNWWCWNLCDEPTWLPHPLEAPWWIGEMDERETIPPSLAGPSCGVSNGWSCSHQSTTFLLNVRHTVLVWRVPNPTRFGSIDDAWDEAFDLDGLGAVNFTQLLLPERDGPEIMHLPSSAVPFFSFWWSFWGKSQLPSSRVISQRETYRICGFFCSKFLRLNVFVASKAQDQNPKIFFQSLHDWNPAPPVIHYTYRPCKQ